MRTMKASSKRSQDDGAGLHTEFLGPHHQGVERRSVIFAALAFALSLLVLDALPAEVHAAGADKIRAQQLTTDGLELRRAGKDTDALAKFEEAHRLSPTPRSSAQMGLCLQALGRWSEADVYLSDALNAKSDPWVLKNRTTLKDSLEEVKQNVGRVEINGGPEGSVVAINGRTVGTYPLAGALPVNAGNVDIEVTKPGYKRALRSITIAGGNYQRLLIRLEESEQVTAPVPAASTLPAGTPNTAEGNIVSTPTPDPVETRPIFRRPWAWVVLGALVVGGAVAIGLSTSRGGATSATPDDRRMFE